MSSAVPTLPRAVAVSRTRATDFLVKNPLLVLLVLLVTFVQASTGAQLNWGNLRGVLLDGSVIAIVAVPVAMLVIAGYVDLSVGSTLALGGVVAGTVMHHGAAPALAVCAAVAAGAAIGLVNAVLTTVAGLSSFIVTLGMLTAVRGATQLLSPLPLSSFGDAFAFLGIGNIAGIPLAVIIAAAVLGLAGAFLTLTPAGRHVYAIGVNREAAYLSGVKIRTIPFVLYLFSGAAAGLAGTITVARLNSAPAGQLGLGFELSVLTAVLLGGIALTGGEGSMFGVLVGVLFLGLLANGLTLLGVTNFWQNVASGLALVAAIAIAAGTHVLRGRLLAREASRLATPPS
ncbi:ABC transporter permease [Cryptosporangium aurantiacum]|uniref:Ribose transport system permease protein n=1 Tax=Cryptosporangium aurantiacum TaxID=134849 RepID=A0A1M7R0M4_9ACTN|nr:ABC transporter permease [Cryptosporangium aurantiacum]SHN38174.1 ribose transport system permease protein [Cryptosporangium aurantiacum]